MRDALLELRRELLRNLVGEHVDEHQHVDVALVIGPYVRRPILRESDRTNVGCRPILLQNSKVAGPQIVRKKTEREVIADSYNLNRITKVACEFVARR
jgi:hypothetical protein